MREIWVKRIIVASAVLVLSSAAVLAWLANAPGRAAPGMGPPAPVDSATDARGAVLLESHGCLACHSIAGRGNPRSPLDGVGARLDRETLRGWIVGDPAVAGSLPGRVRATKEDYAMLPETELDALAEYLDGLVQ